MSRFVIWTIQGYQGAWNSPSTASLKTFEGSIIQQGETASTQVGNCQLAIGYQIKAMPSQGLLFELFRAIMALGTARQLHLWRHLKESSSIGGRQFARELEIVNWERDVTAAQDNIKVCFLNYSELPRCPGAARQLHLWEHLKDPLSIWGRQPVPELAIINWEWDVI